MEFSAKVPKEREAPLQNEAHQSFDLQLRDPITSAEPKNQELNRTFDVISDFITQQKGNTSYREYADSAKRTVESNPQDSATRKSESKEEKASEGGGSRRSNTTANKFISEKSRLSVKELTDKFRKNRKSQFSDSRKREHNMIDKSKLNFKSGLPSLSLPPLEEVN